MKCVLLVSRYKLLDKGTLTSCSSVKKLTMKDFWFVSVFIYLLDCFAGTKCVESSLT
jgi:hypothetical protein